MGGKGGRGPAWPLGARPRRLGWPSPPSSAAAARDAAARGAQGAAKIVGTPLAGGKVSITKIDSVLLPGTVRCGPGGRNCRVGDVFDTFARVKGVVPTRFPWSWAAGVKVHQAAV
jgi:hypothetical protein